MELAPEELIILVASIVAILIIFGLLYTAFGTVKLT